MHFLDAEIFSEVVKLSNPTLIAIVLCGLLLWSAGYLTHKFWVVFLATAGAGVLGFDKGPDFGIQGVFAALLFGISAGILALSIIRVVVFVFGGCTGIVVGNVLMPAGDAWLACLLIGGIAALLLYPFWFTALSSLLGTLASAYGIIAILDKLNALDSSNIVDKHAGLVDVICIGFVVFGTIIQYFLTKYFRKRKWRLMQEEERFRAQNENLAREL
jgi:hypothetical protein